MHSNKKKFIVFSIPIFALIIMACVAFFTDFLADKDITSIYKHVRTEEIRNNETPAQVLDSLKRGNSRFVNQEEREIDYGLIKSYAAIAGQFPYATILSCMDSRSIPEILFNQPPGNLFVIRNAGNVVNTDVLASMEYANEYVGSKLIVVMGHTGCGAAKGACSIKGTGHLVTLLEKFAPAINSAEETEVKNCTSDDFINNIVKQNVINQIQAIENQSPALHKLIDNGTIMLVGAIHDLKTNKVTFFDADGKEL
ncbi:MAG: carbonic anhydrase [Legionellales bacterium]|jgi:carbonic anhydrase